jgi:diadenosine tetraphosphate (Ap4A) HIT family hydrolase
MPPELHHRLARNADLETQALAAFLAKLGDHLRATAGADGEPGFVTFIQHFGSTLNLHVHFHVLALDGVYVRAGEAAPTFRRAREPTQAELEALVAAAAQRIRKLTGRSDADEVPAVEAPLLKLIGAEPVELELPEKRLTAEHDGFNLHAATAFEEHEHDAIERFPRKRGRSSSVVTLREGRSRSAGSRWRATAISSTSSRRRAPMAPRTSSSRRARS